VPFDTSIDLNVTPVDQTARMDASTFFGRLAPLMRDNPTRTPIGFRFRRVNHSM
jgi:hypothetical protein